MGDHEATFVVLALEVDEPSSFKVSTEATETYFQPDHIQSQFPGCVSNAHYRMVDLSEIACSPP